MPSWGGETGWMQHQKQQNMAVQGNYLNIRVKRREEWGSKSLIADT